MPNDQHSMRTALRKAINKLPIQVRLRAQNSLEGFERALKLLPIDREMASFRAITAEEEAAAALFRCLQLQKYPGSENLSFRNHHHKAALGPFLGVVQAALAAERQLTIHIELNYSEPSIQVSVPLSELGLSFKGSEDLQLTLVEPLGLVAKKADGSHPSHYFDTQMRKLVETTKSGSICKLIAQEANARNRLLYSSDSSLPCSKATAHSIELRRSRAEIALYLCIAVLQTPNHQGLATQALEAFLRIVGEELEKELSYPEPPPEFLIKMNHDAPSDVEFLGDEARLRINT